MIEKNNLYLTFMKEPVQRASWVPFAGVHSGKLKNYTAKEVLQNKEALLESLLEVNKVYRPDGQPILFDLQLEAEILGCDLLWQDDCPPTVCSHPLEGTTDIPTYLPKKDDKRLKMVLEVMDEMVKRVGDTTMLYGLICGPFTLASHLRGTEIFFDMIDEEDYVHQLLDYCTEVCLQMAKYYVDAKMNVIGFVDPLVSQISPNHFEEFLTKPYTTLFDYVREQNRFSSFFVCGDATKNLEVMCKTKPDCISIDENIDIKKAKAVCDQYGLIIGGNIQLTITMLHGSQQDNMKAVCDIIEKCDGFQNLIVSPGCDMPFATPIENGIAVSQAVLNYEETLKVLQNYEGNASFKDIVVELPDYTLLKRPFIEVFTLDSASCAACGYMMNVVNELKDECPNLFDSVEYKFTLKENIARCMKVGVKNLPSIYLNGKLLYSSIIPSKSELQEKILNCEK